jgi:GntR family transcriptional regulator
MLSSCNYKRKRPDPDPSCSTLARMSAPTAVMDRTSPVPLHHQLKMILAEMVHSGELSPGDPLPGELRLCEQYGISRTVVRQALVQLEFEGLVERMRGRGTFVATPRTPQGLVQSLSGQFEDLAARGLHLRSEVRTLELVPAPAHAAAALGIAEGDQVVLLERLRFVQGEPWVLVITYLLPDAMAWLQHVDLVEGSLYAAMERQGVRPVHGRRTIQAKRADKATAEDLGVRRGTPILLLTSTGLDRHEHPVEYYEALHRGDRTVFEVDLVRSDAVV